MNGPLHAAHWFLERGWTPLPIEPRGKQPLVPWRRLQREHPTPADLEHWWSLWPEANVGIVTGAASRLAVLDMDSEEALQRAAELGLPDCAPRAKTTRGEHLYCQADRSVPTGIVMPGLEVRGEGAYIIAPPSVHFSGALYTWIIPPDGELPPLPEWADRQAVSPRQDREAGWVARALRGVEEGRRNATCARLAGYLLAKGVPVDVAEAFLLGWNRLNRPPLPDDGVCRTVASITARGRRQRTEALPFTEASLLEFLTGPGRRCTHGARSTYQALCAVEWVRGLPPGSPLFVSYRELTAYGGVSPQRAHEVLSRLAKDGLVRFEPAGRAGGLRGQAATVRRLLPLHGDLNKGETNQLVVKEGALIGFTFVLV